MAVWIKIKNAGALAAKQKGVAGAIASGVAPEVVAAQVDEAVAAELATALKAKGVEADVGVTQSAAETGIGELVAAGLGFGLGLLVGHRRKSHE